MTHAAEGFSLAAYGALLELASESGYRFPLFRDLGTARHSPELQCLLRHDVDVSLELALRMARLEAEKKAVSTYFVMLRSPAYNLMSRHSTSALQEIVALGHEIGIHFDAAHPAALGRDLSEEVLREARIVGECAGQEVRSVSFHQPSAFILTNDIVIEGLINTYSPSQMEGWHYVSDSNRHWKGKDPVRILSGALHPKIQLLVHPIWWTCDTASTEAAWDEALIGNFDAMQRQFLDTEGAYGGARRMSLAKITG